MANTSVENQIKSWLEIALEKENVKHLSVDILGNSEKGDGYNGDIAFVSATGVSENNAKKEYNFVVKCSKKSQGVQEDTLEREVFLNEIFIYEKLFPYYTQFQKEKCVAHPFLSFPKCYGCFAGENMEVIVLENLKTSGYELWPKQQPLTRKHIDMIVTEYGKFHATSVAIGNERPDEFQKLLKNLLDVFPKRDTKMQVMFEKVIENSYELLMGDVDEEILSKWKKFGEEVEFVLYEMTQNHVGLKVVLHGDCWNNNFMYINDKNNKCVPLKVAFLDWQLSRYSSPILDLSYFLFSCLSEEDMDNMEEILSTYHKSFVNQLKGLGTTGAEEIYPFQQLLEDWKRFSRFGILMTSLLMKIVSTEKDEVLDEADSGKDLTETFTKEIRDKENYKRRIRPVVEYVVKHGLI